MSKAITKFGPYSIISAIAGITGLFFGGIHSSIFGFIAVFTGAAGIRRHEKFYTIGVLLGSCALIFVNLQYLGIINNPDSIKINKKHLINSISATILAHQNLKNNDKNKVIECLNNALSEAEMVDIAGIEKQVSGFANHYNNEFIEGIKLLIEGQKNSSIKKSVEGGLLMDKWARWNKENRRKLGKIKESSPSIISLAAHYLTGNTSP